MSDIEKILNFIEGTIPADDPYGYRGQTEDGFDGSWSEFEWACGRRNWGPKQIDGQEIPGVGLAKYVTGYGGEGQGEERWFVFEVNGVLYRKSGYYMSYDGTTWDGDFEVVKPVEKTITVYEAV